MGCLWLLRLRPAVRTQARWADWQLSNGEGVNVGVDFFSVVL